MNARWFRFHFGIQKCLGTTKGGSYTALQMYKMPLNCSLFLKKSLFIYFQRKGKRGRREKHQRVVASHVPPTGGLAHIPGMCPDQELNQRPFGSQAGAQSMEPHQPGPELFVLKWLIFCYTNFTSINYFLRFFSFSILLFKLSYTFVSIQHIKKINQ